MTQSSANRFLTGSAAFWMMLGLVLVVHADSLVDLAAFWRLSPGYNHGALVGVFVLLAAAYEISRHQAPLIVQPRPYLLGLLAVGTALSLAAMAEVMLAQMLFLSILVWGLIAYLYGSRVALRLSFLFVAFYLTLPIWDFMITPLQKATIAVSNTALDALHMTAYLDGDFVILRHGVFEIERGCGGFRSFFTAAILGAFYAHAFVHRLSHQLLVFVSGLALAVLANWIRVLTIIIVGDITEMQHSLLHDHSLFSWTLFYFMMFWVIPLSRFLNKRSQRTEMRANETSSTAFVTQLPASTVVPLIVVLIFPPAVGFATELAAGPATDPEISLPDRIAEWRRMEGVANSDHYPYFPDAPVSASARYTNGRLQVEVFVSAYDIRGSDAEMIGYPNSWYDSELWSRIRSLEATWPDSGTFKAPQAQLLHGESGKRVLLGGYVFDARVTSSSLEGKGLEIRSRALGEHHVFALSVSAGCENGCNQVAEEVGQFARAVNRYGLSSLIGDRE